MNFQTPKVLFSALTCVLLILSLTSCSRAQYPPVNIALGKTVTFNKAPNYDLCTDPDDKTQLTDGKYSSEGNPQQVENTSSLWGQKGTVGWSGIMPVVITIDLGSEQPISGVSYSTAAGVAGVNWPDNIFIATSDNNKTWHYAGDLVHLSQKKGAPPANGYANFRYVTHDLHTKGRYISFGIVETPYTFVDEIEVYKGDDAWLSQPAPGQTASDMETFVQEAIITSDVQRRLNEDIAEVRREMDQPNVSPDVKSTFTAHLDKDTGAAAQMGLLPVDAKTFKTILPLNETHRDILAVHGELLGSQGFKPLTVWKKHRYAWLPLLAKPDLQSKPQLSFSMLRNQFRSDDLLLTNASGKSQIVALQLKNAPRNAQDGWLQVYSVTWTDTAQGTPVADALLPVLPQNGVYSIDLPAGMTRKVWFTVDSSKLPAGAYQSTFTVSGAGQRLDVPLSLNISRIAMNTPRFSMGMWDYTDGDGSYGITVNNRKAAIAMMRSHFVDTPWASGAVLPWPGAADFDAKGNVKTTLDFSRFDQWVAMWPGARRYFVFASVSDSFAGAQMATPEFNARVGSWAKVLSAHMKQLHLQPKQLGILLVDEPNSDAQDAIIAAWAKAIKAVAPELTLFQDPTWQRPDQINIQDSITQADILCPNFPIFKSGGAPVQKYFTDLHDQGKTLWFYQCTGPVRLYDPQGYYRYQPLLPSAPPDRDSGPSATPAACPLRGTITPIPPSATHRHSLTPTPFMTACTGT